MKDENCTCVRWVYDEAGVMGGTGWRQGRIIIKVTNVYLSLIMFHAQCCRLYLI